MLNFVGQITFAWFSFFDSDKDENPIQCDCMKIYY